MKWASHKILTGATAFALSGSVIPSLLAVVGSTLPDAMEGTGENWQRRHRRFSHWVVPYLAVAFLLHREAAARGVEGIYIDDIVAMSLDHVGLGALAIFWIVFGCLCHLLQDAVSGKIPILDPRKRRGFTWIKTGSFLEYAVVTATTLGVILWKVVIAPEGAVRF